MDYQEINAALIARGRKTRLELSSKGNFLRIRFTYQGRLRRISPHLQNNAIDLPKAEDLALEIDRALTKGTFSMEDWTGANAGSGAAPTYQEAIETLYLKRCATKRRTHAFDRTWEVDYLQVFGKLAGHREVCVPELREMLLSQPPGTRQRLRYGIALGALLDAVGMPVEAAELRGLGKGYNPMRDAKPREIPTDEQVVDGFGLIAAPYQRAYALMATYGCRPHEAIVSRLEGELLSVPEKTKTGSRLCLPNPKEWILRFSVRDLPMAEPVSSASICKAFKRADLGFTPYALRHAWAIRTIRDGRIKDSMAAKSLGHGLGLHVAVYQKWQSAAEFEALLR